VAEIDQRADKRGIDLGTAGEIVGRRAKYVVPKGAEQCPQRRRVGIGFREFSGAERVPTQWPLGLQLGCPLELAFGVPKVAGTTSDLSDAKPHEAQPKVQYRVVAMLARAVDAARFECQQRRRIRDERQRIPQPEHGGAVWDTLPGKRDRTQRDQQGEPDVRLEPTKPAQVHRTTSNRWLRM